MGCRYLILEHGTLYYYREANREGAPGCLGLVQPLLNLPCMCPLRPQCRLMDRKDAR